MAVCVKLLFRIYTYHSQISIAGVWQRTVAYIINFREIPKAGEACDRPWYLSFNRSVGRYDSGITR